MEAQFMGNRRDRRVARVKENIEFRIVEHRLAESEYSVDVFDKLI